MWLLVGAVVALLVLLVVAGSATLAGVAGLRVPEPDELDGSSGPFDREFVRTPDARGAVHRRPRRRLRSVEFSADGVEETATACVDVELGIVLEVEVIGDTGAVLGTTGRTTAVEVRAPRESDFDLEPEIVELLGAGTDG